MTILCVFIFVIYFCVASSTIVEWAVDAGFDIPTNYENNKLPCSKETVILDNNVNNIIVTADYNVAGLVLSENVDIVLDGSFTFGEDENDKNCDKSDVNYRPRTESNWEHPDVWISPDFNEATPHAERRPCRDDVAKVPERSTFLLIFPDMMQYVKYLIIGNVSITTQSSLRDKIDKEDSQYFVLNQFLETGIEFTKESCKKIGGCDCQDNMEVDCSPIECPIPKCADPIRPIGHCCKICGGVINFKVDSDRFDLKVFEKQVQERVKSYGPNLVYHIGRIPENLVQLVVVEKGGYDGTSAIVVNQISYDHSGLGTMYLSGTPLSKTGMGAKIAVSMFFVVLIAMGVIYAYYYKLPAVRIPAVGGGLGRGILSRFAQRTDSVVSLTSRRGSTDTIGSAVNRSFRNPLYDSKRGRVQVEETVDEEE